MGGMPGAGSGGPPNQAELEKMAQGLKLQPGMKF